MIMEAGGSKISFPLRGESPLLPTSFCFPPWAVTKPTRQGLRKSFRDLQVKRVFLWEGCGEAPGPTQSMEGAPPSLVAMCTFRWGLPAPRYPSHPHRPHTP